jgi:hypothetical protein
MVVIGREDVQVPDNFQLLEGMAGILAFQRFYFS